MWLLTATLHRLQPVDVELEDLYMTMNVLIQKVRNRLQKYLPPKSQKRMMREITKYYNNRFLKYSGCKEKSYIRDGAYMTWLSHVIEKGLAMPNMRLGFGKDKILELLKFIDEYEKKYRKNDMPYIMAINVLKVYREVHQKNNYKIDDTIQRQIDALPDVQSKEVCQKFEYTAEDFFAQRNSPFPEFAEARKSVRNYDVRKRVSLDDLIDAIKIARTAPSACDRQPARVHIITNRDKVNRCLALQNGNRGFGYLADKLLVICGDLRTVLGAQEYFDLNTNIGIFLMNLSYALYYKKIGHCILNWYALPDVDKKLRQIISIPEEENIAAFIVCGVVPENFNIAVSPRFEVEHFYTVE